MQWCDAPGGGFTEPDIEPWLPLGDAASANVADQEHDPGSVLALTRALIARRRADADLREGAYTSLPTGPGVWAWRRGERALVALNLSDHDAEVAGVTGAIRRRCRSVAYR